MSGNNYFTDSSPVNIVNKLIVDQLFLTLFVYIKMKRIYNN